MTSKREAAIVRLLAIAGTIEGINRVTRNDAVVGEGAEDRPLIQVWDGNEEANAGDPVQTRRLGQGRRVTMFPHCYVMVGEDKTTAGTTLNTLVERFQNAVLTDSALDAILDGSTGGGGIEYEGLGDRNFPAGRTAEGEVLVRFAFHYILKPVPPSTA